MNIKINQNNFYEIIIYRVTGIDFRCSILAGRHHGCWMVAGASLLWNPSVDHCCGPLMKNHTSARNIDYSGNMNVRSLRCGTRAGSIAVETLLWECRPFCGIVNAQSLLWTHCCDRRSFDIMAVVQCSRRRQRVLKVKCLPNQ